MIATGRENTLSAFITVLGQLAGSQYSVKIMLYSPLLAKVNILKYGTNTLRKRQLHIQYKGLNRAQFLQPIIKGKSRTGKKAREEFVRKKLLRKMRK